MASYVFPIKYYEHNLIFDQDKNCWALYRIQGENYEYLSYDLKKILRNRLSRLMINVGEEYKLLLLPFNKSIDEHFDKLKKKMKGPLKDLAVEYCDGTREFLKSKSSVEGNEYKIFLVVKLKKVSNEILKNKDFLKSLIKEPIRLVDEVMNLAAPEIFEYELNTYLELEGKLFSRIRRWVGVEREYEYTIQYLIRRNFWRSISEPPMRGDEEDKYKIIEMNGKILKRKYKDIFRPAKDIIDKNGKVAIRPLKRDILSFTEGDFENKSRHIEIKQIVDGKVKTSYQAFITFSHIPDNTLIFPGVEYLYLIQDLYFPVEIMVHVEQLNNKEALNIVRKKKREIKDQIDHASKFNNVSDSIREDEYTIREQENELEATKEPMLLTSIVFCVSDNDKKHLDEKISFLIDLYEDMGFELQNPSGSQFKLFNEFIPGAGRYETSYIHKLPPKTLAGGMLIGTKNLGDNEGQYFARMGQMEQPIYLDASNGPKRNKNGNQVFLGQQGTGKSYGANNIFYQSIISGGMGLSIDPKGDRSHWEKTLGLGEHCKVVTLTEREVDRGKLDPFIIYKNDLESAASAAVSVMSMVRKEMNDDDLTFIMGAVNYAKNQPKPCLNLTIEYFKKKHETEEDENYRARFRALAEFYENLKGLTFGNLLFGSGDEETFDLSTRLTVVQIQNLTLPDSKKSRENYNLNERLSAALIYEIGQFAIKFIHLDRSIFKIVQMDEAWVLTGTDQGKELVGKLLREGRAMNSGLQLITQNTKDLEDEGIKDHLSLKFIYKSQNKQEVLNMLELLRLPPTEENIETIMKLEHAKGECLFQDFDGRIGKIRHHVVYKFLDEAFDTTPPEQKDTENMDEAV
ncbi:ATP-binding protein [Paramaledivibacter caminithermalis]|uniref:AAA-like domain-containing protein n=1 Tax=Paramaledivibacter caminithermalis (strain DSM 15212 / CIP 107654 / DViRD3) TaxID=1121301 RepID=A0A1M6SS16_PARC5|nr:ATP-binding protein [Paramaledivibacter caminithermalis]SHK47388.1 AAA-like domain-containing protein [Paramaledivibacter caminithermalis DSM 15212]